LCLYIEYALRLWNLVFRWPKNKPLTSSWCSISGLQNDCNNHALSRIPTEESSVPLPLINTSYPSPWYCDASHWLFTVTLAITLAELIIATIPTDPYIKLLAMVNPSMFFPICLFIFVLDITSFMHVRAPFRISSTARAEYVRPGIYTLLDDVIAVDLGGGYTFRTKFNEHWQASPILRRRLSQLSIFWSLSGLLVCGACTIVIFTTDVKVGFAVGWGLPYLWIILWTAITVVVSGF